MSFLHVFGTIGKDILKAAPTIVKALPIPAPIAFGAATGLAIINAELNGGTGPDKKATVLSTVTPMVSDAPSKLSSIEKVLEGLVMALNGLSEIFPGAPSIPKD